MILVVQTETNQICGHMYLMVIYLSWKNYIESLRKFSMEMGNIMDPGEVYLLLLLIS